MRQIVVACGDIVRLPCDGIVCLSRRTPDGLVEPNERMASLAGSDMVKEFTAVYSLCQGDVLVTEGHNFPVRCIIHCLWEPVEGEDLEEKMAKCYAEILRIATAHEVELLAIPTIKCGEDYKGLSEGIGMAVECANDWFEENSSDVEIVFCAETKEEMELYQMFYPICSWTNERKFKESVMDLIEHIVSTKKLKTKELAMQVIKEMVRRAVETRDEKVIQVYHRLEYEIAISTDKEYECLYKSVQSSIKKERKRASESNEIWVIRQFFANAQSALTRKGICLFCDVETEKAQNVIDNLVKMNYINIDRFEGDEIVYKILVPPEEFYLIHGE